jgi:hypothetical protein
MRKWMHFPERSMISTAKNCPIAQLLEGFELAIRLIVAHSMASSHPVTGKT